MSANTLVNQDVELSRLREELAAQRTLLETLTLKFDTVLMHMSKLSSSTEMATNPSSVSIPTQNTPTPLARAVISIAAIAATAFATDREQRPAVLDKEFPEPKPIRRVGSQDDLAITTDPDIGEDCDDHTNLRPSSRIKRFAWKRSGMGLARTFRNIPTRKIKRK